MCLLTACFILQAKDALPQGKWTTVQITSEKNTDGKVQTIVFDSAAGVRSHIPCPQELEIQEKGIVLHYPDGWKESASYTLEGDSLTLFIPVGNQTYKCEIKEDSLTLTATYQYVNNDLSAKKSEKISEKRMIAFKKK